MRTSFEHYFRLAKGPLGMSSLWAGQNHLVHVLGHGVLLPYAEQYRRYRYSDIQAFSLVKTSRALAFAFYTLGLLLLAGLSTIFFFIGDGIHSPVNRVCLAVLSVFALVLVALLIRHWILGPTCVCHIQTTASQERLAPLRRYHVAQQVIAALEDRIEESQAHLLLSPSASVENPPATFSARNRLAGLYTVPKVFPPTLLVYLALGFAGLATVHLESIWLVGATSVTALAASLLSIVALIAAVKKPTPESLKKTLWMLMGLLFTLVATASVCYLIAAIGDPAYTVDLFGPLEALAGAAANANGAFYYLFVANSLAFLFVSLTGLMLAARWKNRIRQQQGENIMPGQPSPEESDAP